MVTQQRDLQSFHVLVDTEYHCFKVQVAMVKYLARKFLFQPVENPWDVPV